MKIAGMVVWVLTAGIGIYLLAAGIAAQRQAAGGGAAAAEEEEEEEEEEEPDPLARGTAPGTDGATMVGAAALARITAPGGGAAAGGGGPGGEGSPLLEFVHPLLALLGLTFWIFFVMTGDRLFAWIAFGVVMAAVLAGLSWAGLTRRAARRAARPGDREPTAAAGPAFPAHLVMVHGLAATCTVALVVISAVTAAHG